MNSVIVRSTRHPTNQDPIVILELQRSDEQIYKKNMEDIIIHISARSRYDNHYLFVSPSCAVNPPWKQYFAGVKYEFIGMPALWKDTDNRAIFIKEEIFRALDIRNERDNKQATWKEYRALIAKVKNALIKLDNINLRRTH